MENRRERIEDLYKQAHEIWKHINLTEPMVAPDDYDKVLFIDAVATTLYYMNGELDLRTGITHKLLYHEDSVPFYNGAMQLLTPMLHTAVVRQKACDINLLG